jgi:transcriptional regulator with GAF, ATPase, and Fis domain
MTEVLDYAADLAGLAQLASRPQALGDVLRSALASLREVVPYDLAVVYELRGEVLQARAAEGPLADARVRAHTLPLAKFPSIARALEQRRPIALTEEQHAGEEGDPYDHVLDLPAGHSCMVVPLYAADRSLGIITLDRGLCETYPPNVVQLAGVYGQIVSIAMLFAEQAELLTRYRQQLREEVRLLAEERGDASWAVRQLEGSRDVRMQDLARLAKQVAASDLPVLLMGETGTGKEVLAQAIHAWSRRGEGPFVTLNCAAIPEHLVESELFGHVKGAFSGAAGERAGRFLTANGGTLLLDEIGDMPMPTQAKLLRVLQEGTFEPVGSDKTMRVDVRVIAATHVDLRQAMHEGGFREDLFYRLAGFPLTLPPLRERLEDIGPIAHSVLDGVARRTGRGPWQLTEPALEKLRRYAFPGNVRELANVLERATIFESEGTITPEMLVLATSAPPPTALPSGESFPDFAHMQRDYFRRVLERTKGRIYGDRGAAELVGLKPTTLQSRLKKLGIDPAPLRRH